jgi:DNA polymerase elongation subunit (family B)
MQQEALAILAEAHDFTSYGRKLEEACEILERYLDRVEAGQVSVEEIAISRRLTRSPNDYRQASATAIAAQQLDRSGVALRPGEVIEYIITDADSNFADDRVRALTLWESWRGYDVRQYQQALREAFKPFTHYAPSRGTSTGALHHPQSELPGYSESAAMAEGRHGVIILAIERRNAP